MYSITEKLQQIGLTGREAEVYFTLLIKRKVVVKSIYEYKALKTAEAKKNLASAVKSYVKLGEDARFVPELPMKLAISDERITMFALKNKVSLSPGITTMVVDYPNFAIALKKVFESYWEDGLTLKEYIKAHNI